MGASGRKKYFQPMEWTRSIKSLEGIPDEEYYNKYPSSTNRITKRSHPSTGKMMTALQKRPLHKKMHEDQGMGSSTLQNDNVKNVAKLLMPKKRYAFGNMYPYQFETHNRIPNSPMERVSNMFKPPYLQLDNNVANNDVQNTVTNHVAVRSLEDQRKTLGTSAERPPYLYQ